MIGNVIKVIRRAHQFLKVTDAYFFRLKLNVLLHDFINLRNGNL